MPFITMNTKGNALAGTSAIRISRRPSRVSAKSNTFATIDPLLVRTARGESINPLHNYHFTSITFKVSFKTFDFAESPWCFQVWSVLLCG